MLSDMTTKTEKARKWRGSEKGLVFLSAFACIVLLISASTVLGGLHIDPVYLYDLQGPTFDTRFQGQNSVFCDITHNEVYIADTWNHRVAIFGKEGIQIFQFGQNGELQSPLDVVVNSLGDIYVLQGGSGGRRVEVFDFRGKHLADLEWKGLPEGESFIPQRIALDSRGNIYVSDQMNGCIFAFDSEGYFRLKMLPEMSDEDREEVVFGDLMVDREDRIYLPVSTLGLVYVYNSEGQKVRIFGEKGGGPGKLAFPVDVAEDTHGHFLVLDKMRHCIVVYDSEGRLLTEFGGMGTRSGWFFFPGCLEIDGYGRIYVSQRFGNKVQVLKLKEGMKQ